MEARDLLIPTVVAPTPFKIVVAPEAALNTAAARQLRLDVLAALDDSPPVLVLDLTGVVLIAPAAVALLVESIAAARERTSIVLVASEPQVRTLVVSSKELSGIPLFATRAAALKSLASKG